MQVLTLLILNVLLFGIGLVIVLAKNNIIFIIIGIELILQAAISNCIIFDTQYPDQLQGQVLVIFSIAASICEIVLLIALSLQIHRQYKTTELDRLNSYIQKNEV